MRIDNKTIDEASSKYASSAETAIAKATNHEEPTITLRFRDLKKASSEFIKARNSTQLFRRKISLGILHKRTSTGKNAAYPRKSRVNLVLKANIKVRINSRAKSL